MVSGGDMGRLRLSKDSAVQRIAARHPVAADSAQTPNPFERLIALQRLGGNRAIAQLLTPTVQRDLENPVELVQKAIASSNLDQLIALQLKLRAELAKDPLSPPEPVRAALATARHW